MDAFTRRDLQVLASHRQPWCVSLYLPTDRNGDGMLQTPIRLKNLAVRAEELLVEHGLRAPAARRLLAPLRDLPGDGEFLKGIADGLAIFLDEEGMRSYRVPCRFEELAFVGKRFLVKPLLRLTADEGRFLLLTVSANRVALYEGTRWHLEELRVPGLPANRSEALNYDEPEEVRQVHSGGPPGPQGVRLAYHGQGGRRDTLKDEELEFFRAIDRAISRYLADQRTPLLFAGVEYLFPLFQKTCSYRWLAETPVVGNTDLWNRNQLHDAAWSVASKLLAKDRDRAVAQCQEFAGTDHTLVELESVLQACRVGQVDKLLLDIGQSVWGRLDVESGAVHRDEGSRPGNEDLLDLAVVLALQTSAAVYPVEAGHLPHRSPLAAVLRYPGVAAQLSSAEVTAS
jgi:hypothetical protein